MICLRAILLSLCYVSTAWASDEPVAVLRFWPLLGQSLLALLLVLALFAVFVQLMKRFQGFTDKVRPDSGIQLLHRYRLGARQSLAVVRYGKQEWMIAVSAQDIRLLDRIESSSKAEQRPETIA